jgi:hypothetical protein
MEATGSSKTLVTTTKPHGVITQKPMILNYLLFKEGFVHGVGLL